MSRWDDDIAGRALNVVNDAGEVTDAAFAKYRSRVAEMATMLHLSGVAATLAFLGSRTDPAHQLAGRHLSRELGKLFELDAPDATISRVLKAVVAADVDGRLGAERHARTYAGWLKRAVEIRKQRDATATVGPP